MFHTLNQELAVLQEKLRKKHHLEQHLKALQQELQAAERRLDERSRQLAKEEQDVERLKGWSLDALFLSLIGKKQERLTLEEQEMLQMKARYDEAKDTVEDLKKEIRQKKFELGEVAGVEEEIGKLLERKKQLIREQAPALSQELDECSEQEANLLANLSEIDEALSSGQSLIASLDEAAERLKSARNWGTWDMIGGGMISTAIKHNRIGDARSALHNAQLKLKRFEKELRDMEQDLSIDIQIGGMLAFADYFFDGFITDLIVQSRIHDTMNQIDGKRARIEAVLRQLRDERARQETLLRQTRERAAAILAGA